MTDWDEADSANLDTSERKILIAAFTYIQELAKATLNMGDEFAARLDEFDARLRKLESRNRRIG